MVVWILIAGALAGYLLGSIPPGLLICNAKGVDLRSVGSGNIGATNVSRAVGKKWGIIAFTCDALKGFVAAWVFPQLLPGMDVGMDHATLGLLWGAAAIAGHNWPVYLRFKGGKGVATSAGVLLGVAPLAVAVGIVVWALFFFPFRYVSLASVAAAAAIPIYSWIVDAKNGLVLPIALTVLAAIIIFRHGSNIRRLLNGTESRFERKRSRQQSA